MKKQITIMLSIIIAVILFSGVIFAEKAKKMSFPADKGSKKIDVSKYPDKLKKTYNIFKTKCSKCHTIARPINTIMPDSETWKRYVKRMMRKPDANIDEETAIKLTDFLVYDQEKRKEKDPESFFCALTIDADETEDKDVKDKDKKKTKKWNCMMTEADAKKKADADKKKKKKKK